ncbi:aromatic ring-hydroxylating dioxygenase subunit alpha [Paenibacillus sp. LHD-117]|uniref:aromatic ring-hydroxylating dioxygenase subunit alpha n=1 Tax=Paenibacillus sp. LHD-117 TaxID=3071412 RepID=UPI0027DEBEEE|nr:aromatic ring-hydroxylating dioxygenase subunit alpha [Paenibacillus sp. LHD-117]MDQ6419130.1 aromatic ring-hydroxylating dioxygenase subunit alpha [Paenibacillus sp. LHD-117]
MPVLDPVLVNEWHPVMFSSRLEDRPLQVELLGERVVVFRTSRGVHALKDLCIHRGVPLSLGKVRGDEIVCAYHGWTYDACGTCTLIPSLPRGTAIPSKAKTSSYRCQEAHGLVWVSLGEPDKDVPAIGTRGLLADYAQVFMGPYEVAAAGPRVVENFLDVSHLMYVHEGMLGDSEFSEINDYRVHETDGALRTDEIEVYQPDPDGRGVGVNTFYTYEIYHPMSVSLTKRIEGSDDVFHLYLFVTPQNEEKSIAFMIMERNYAFDEPDETFVSFQDILLEQDRLIVENQKPELLPLDLQAELHLKCDRLSIAYRKLLSRAGVSFGTA